MTAAGWLQGKLGDVVTFQRGYDITKKVQREGPYPVISSSGPTTTHDHFKDEGPGVVIGRKGSLGGVYYSEGPYWPHDTTLWVRDFHGNSPRFVYYLLQTLSLSHYDVGASNPTLNRNHLHLLPVRIPPRPTQETIATVLSAYDDLIENNTRRIQLLEEMAQAIYREWFIEFRFPGHEGVQMVNSELGPIPEGWSVLPLREVSLRIDDGDWIETKDQGGHDYRLLQVSNIGIGEFRETGKCRYITGETFERLRCTELRVGHILVSRMPDPIGRAWYVDYLDEPAITAVDIAIIEPDSTRIDGRYCAFFLNTRENLSRAAARASGTTRPRITRRDLANFPILIPLPQVGDEYAKFLAMSGELKLALTLANRRAREARDLLLPRLISGEIDVSNLDIGSAEPAA